MSERPIELAKNGAAHLLAEVEAELASGAIDEAGWYRRVAAFITPNYLAAATPWAQSGKSGEQKKDIPRSTKDGNDVQRSGKTH